MYGITVSLPEFYLESERVEPFFPLMFMTFNYTTVQICVLTNNVQVIILCLRSDVELAVSSHPNYGLLSRNV